MRIRSIRPEFWSSEDVAAMDWHTRLVFVGLWSYVDDNGVGRDVEALIVAALFPLDGDLPESSRRVTGALRHLSDHGQITRYRVDGKPYLHITSWEKHQRIEKRSTGRYPLPTSGNAEIRESSPTPPGALPEPSPLGEGEKGRRGEGEKRQTTSSSAPRAPRSGPAGTRIPDDFTVTDEMRVWAHEQGWADRWIDQVTEQFRDYWRAKAGRDATKTDWVATWRNWLRRDAERHQAPAAAVGAGTPSGKPAWEL